MDELYSSGVYDNISVSPSSNELIDCHRAKLDDQRKKRKKWKSRYKKMHLHSLESVRRIEALENELERYQSYLEKLTIYIQQNQLQYGQQSVLPLQSTGKKLEFMDIFIPLCDLSLFVLQGVISQRNLRFSRKRNV